MKIDLWRMAGEQPRNGQRLRTRRAVPTTRQTAPQTIGRPVRLSVTGVSPLSVFRFSLIFAFLCLLALLVGLFVLFVVLSATGALAAVERAINSGGIGHDFHFSLAWILWHVGLVGSVLVVLSAILAACGAAMFGAVAESIGGIEITVAEVSRSEQSSQGTREQRRVAA